MSGGCYPTKGPAGPAGPAGAAGAKGDKGDTGAQGPKGDTGATGAQGLKGDKGDTGATGAQGPKGDTGATGPAGAAGTGGTAGAKGDKGDKGDTGATGPAGPEGPAGPKGDKGDTGPAGTAGSDATVPDASPTTKGKIEIATPAEAVEATSDSLALTPVTGKALFKDLEGVEEFTAHTAIAVGTVVALRSDGKVEAVGVSSSTPASIGTKTEYTTRNVSSSIHNVSYDVDKNRAVIMASDGNFELVVRAADVDLATNQVTYTTQATTSVAGGARPIDRINGAYDLVSKKHVVAYRDRTGLDLCVRTVTLDASNNPVISAEFVLKAGINPFGITLTHSESAGKTVLTWNDKVAILDTSGATPTLGTEVTLPIGPSGFFADAIELTQKRVLWFASGTGNITKGVVIDLSGATPTTGTAANLNSGNVSELYTTNTTAAVQDPTTGLVLFMSKNAAVTDGDKSVYSSLTITGTTITASAFTELNVAYGSLSMSYDATAGAIAAVWKNSSTQMRLSSMSLSPSGVLTENVVNVSEEVSDRTFSLYFPGKNKTVIGFIDRNNSGVGGGSAMVFTPQSFLSNAGEWVGVAKKSVAAGEKVPVWLNGGTATTAATLVTGEQYYVSPTGDLSTDSAGSYIGRALTANKLRIVHCGDAA